MYITRLASNEIFSPSNKIHREVGRAKDLSAPLYQAHLYEHLLDDSNIRCRKQITASVKTGWLIMGDYFLFPQEHRDTDPPAEGQSGHRDPCHAQCLLQGRARNRLRRYYLDRQPLYLLHTCFGE